MISSVVLVHTMMIVFDIFVARIWERLMNGSLFFVLGWKGCVLSWRRLTYCCRVFDDTCGFSEVEIEYLKCDMMWCKLEGGSGDRGLCCVGLGWKEFGDW